MFEPKGRIKHQKPNNKFQRFVLDWNLSFVFWNLYFGISSPYDFNYKEPLDYCTFSRKASRITGFFTIK
jgi:hypothetical protein